MYEVTGWHKFGERDYYETGCDPDEYIHFDGPERWSAVTVKDLLLQLRGFVGVDEDYEIELDSCDEDGRVDIQVLETADSCPVSIYELEKWRRGELALWYSTYTFYVEEVTRKSARLVEEQE